MGKRAPKATWEEETLTQLTHRGKRGKYVKADDLKATRAYAAPAREYWRVVAGVVEEGKIKVPVKKGVAARRVGTPARREAALRDLEGPQEQRGAAILSLREWLEKRATRTDSAWHVKPAMVEAAADNLKNQARGRPRQAIQAAMVELAAKKEVRIEHVIGGEGWVRDGHEQPLSGP